MWDDFLTRVNPNEDIFQKLIPHVLSNISHKITWSWNQMFLISKSWDNFSTKDDEKHEANVYRKSNFWKKFNMESRAIKRKSKYYYSCEICSSLSEEFWKVIILRNIWEILRKMYVSSFSNAADTHPNILPQKGLQEGFPKTTSL